LFFGKNHAGSLAIRWCKICTGWYNEFEEITILKPVRDNAGLTMR
jgi:hypothetical protein